MVGLKDVDQVSGKIVPLTTGPVTYFLATSKLPTATAVDPTLTGSAILTVNSAASGAPPTGMWLVQLDAIVLTAALLDALFATVTPYLIIQKIGGVRVYVEMLYTPSRAGVVV